MTATATADERRPRKFLLNLTVPCENGEPLSVPGDLWTVGFWRTVSSQFAPGDLITCVAPGLSFEIVVIAVLPDGSSSGRAIPDRTTRSSQPAPKWQPRKKRAIHDRDPAEVRLQH